MARTQTERKNEWNSRNYERITVMVKAGDREKLQAAAKAEGLSVNRLILDSINAQRPGLLSPLDDTSKQKKHITSFTFDEEGNPAIVNTETEADNSTKFEVRFSPEIWKMSDTDQNEYFKKATQRAIDRPEGQALIEYLSGHDPQAEE